MTYTAPKARLEAFHCPHCAVYAHQHWGLLFGSVDSYRVDTGLQVAICVACNGQSVWRNEQMMIPIQGHAPAPNPDMPVEVLADYEEANTISSLSPRGAAALLRLGLEKLCQKLANTGKGLDKDIAALVEKGLPLEIQQALDSVRVIGNEAVHPGSLDLRDDRETVGVLFALVNLIVHNRITQPKIVQDLYDKLPQVKRDAIAVRDRNTPKT